MANCLILGHTPCPISPLSENNHVHGVEATDDLVEQLGSNSDQHGSELQNLTDTHSREVELESLSESVQQERRSERFSEPTPDLPEVKIETEKMEAVAQASNPIPSLEDLIITDTAADGGDNGQTTQPRVPDLSGKGAVTLATEENSSDLGIDGPVCVLNGINESLNPPGTEDAPENNNTTPKDLSSKSSGGKSKRKEDKAIEHILKALNSLDTTEEKLAALCKKYADLHEEHRVQQASFKQTQKKMQVTSREKDQLQSEHNKAVMAKGKLESLCRELQKHNKLIKEESITRAREEEERRKEVSSKFQCTISEIQAQMQDNHDRNIKLKEENIELGHKLKSLVEQYETREEHVEKLMKHRDLETQLHEAKLQQAQVLLQSEQEQNRKEREVVLMTMTETKKKSDLHEAQEKQLRSQLAMYTEKFDEFQTTLNKSNEVFGKFKTEMDKMTKRIKKLEKESAMWRGKWEASNKNLLEMAEEKQKHDKEKVLFRAKIEKLESLCRALQAERRGKGAEGSLPEMGLESGDKEKTFDPTKTPPNTPDVPSRTSPETVQGAADGQGEGLNSAAQPVTASELADGEGPIPASLPIQEQLEAAPVSEAEIPPANDLPLPEQPSVSQSDDSGAAQLSEPVSASQSNHTAAAPANQLDASVQNAD